MKRQKRKSRNQNLTVLRLWQTNKRRNRRDEGYILPAVVGVLFALMLLFVAYSLITRVEGTASLASADSNNGFYVAQAGLNQRADQLQQRFIGYTQPSGTSPTSAAACTQSNSINQGSKDFACQTNQLSSGSGTSNDLKQIAYTYVVPENNGIPTIATIPPGEAFQNLTVQEYDYQVYSVAQKAGNSNPEAILELDMSSRLIPIFQFLAFFNGDLELLPSPPMNLHGPLHANGHMYLGADNSLNITGQLTLSGNLYNKRKDDNSFKNGTVQVANPSNNLKNILDANSGQQTTSALSPQNLANLWGSQISIGPGSVATLPSAGLLDTTGDFYTEADLRITYQPSSSPPFSITAIDRSSQPAVSVNLSSSQLQSLMQPVQVPAPYASATTICPNGAANCIIPAPIQNVTSFYNNREGRQMNILQLNILGLAVWNKINGGTLYKIAPADPSAPLGSFQQLGLAASDTSEGGLVIHATIYPSAYSNAAGNQSPYGFALTQGAQLLGLAKYANAPSSFSPTGVSIVSDQAIYVQGDYNSNTLVQNKQGAAIMADSINVLSNSCHDANFTINCGIQNNQSNATPTTINTGFLSGTDNTIANTSTSNYSGGLENYPRFHENWQPGGNKQYLTYRGSFVSTGIPQHVSGKWTSQVYTPPGRNWDYDTDFNNAVNLPPLTPRLVYLKQKQFLRTFN